MLDCQGSGKEAGDADTISCNHCNRGSESQEEQIYWGIQLDQDLLETIASIYPEWFQDWQLSMASQQNGYGQQAVIPLLTDMGSPPQATVDEASLQKAMDKNKESLKVKLMLRRPIAQLVEQGILPPLKTPPAFHEQRQKLERAKMGDILKNKIQRRPDRQELIQQHILEDTTVDPSLQDKQRQLKKARLADDLNDRLSHRPGPLELIKGNILQTDEKFAQAVKEGQIQFKRTCEGQTLKHPPPRFIIEEDSGSEGALSPPQDVSQQSPTRSDNFLTYFEVSLPSPALPLGSQGPSPSLHVEGGCMPLVSSPSPSSTPNPPSSVASCSSSILSPAAAIATASISSLVSVGGVGSPPQLLLTQQQQHGSLPLQSQLSQQQQQQQQTSLSQQAQPQQSRESSNKARKKSKSKAQPKARTIKFHEYKGPPSAQKSQAVSPSQAETSYELLLQQQQLFLQWQLEWQQKYPQIILPATQKNPGDQGLVNGVQLGNGVQLSPSPHQSPQQHGGQGCPPHQGSPPPPQQPQMTTSVTSLSPQQQQSLANAMDLSQCVRALNKLEDMKVSDLKAELKKRNLPVSGSKPQLIERLKPYTELSTPTGASVFNSAVACITTQGLTLNMGDILLDTALAASNHTLDSLGCPTPAPAAMATASLMMEPLVEIQQQFKGSPPPSVVPMDIDSNSNNAMDAMDVSESALTNNDIVRLQQKRIEELQRQLQRSQMALQQQQHSLLQPSGSPVSPLSPSAPSNNSNGRASGSPPPSLQQQPVGQEQLKPLHRQLLQQHLQHKIQLQQMQNLQQSLPNVNGLLQNSGGTSPSSAAVKASLAAFLHSQQQAASQQEQSNNNNNSSRVPSPPAMPQSPASPPQPQEAGNDKSPRAPSVLVNQANSMNHQRTSSLPNFTSLLTGKLVGQPQVQQQQQPPQHMQQKESGRGTTPTEQPQFVISRPPPDYDEATKQLNKQQFAAGVLNHLSGKGKGQKSFKSQAVDDVLEILIKNGELPPSAAQEPPTPTTPESAKNSGNASNTQPPVFPAVSSPSPATPNNNNNDTEKSPPSVPCPVTLSPGSPPPPTLSLMEPLTPPPSSMLTDAETGGNSALDFDFHLDLDDIEAMDLGALSSSDHVMPKDGICSTGSTHHHSDIDMGMMNNMDIELSDWLDVMIPTGSGSNTSMLSSSMVPPNCSSSSGSGYTNGLNNYGSGHDPLLSNLGHNHDPFDLFAVDDMDFKMSNDLSTLSWDKVDFAA